jgi:hypothetical protein
MSAIRQLLALADEYRRVVDVDDTTVSWRLFGDSKKLKAIRDGADIQVTRWEKAVQWLSDNWPEGAVWPAEVARPISHGAAA